MANCFRVVTEPTPTPLLSIVVPVYRVEAYLLNCLDSIHADIPADEVGQVEVVAVDDASPDRCGDLLRGYAAEHPGLRVLHLDRNVGLGPARNAGLDVATGRYVWFVDSDDWLPAGTIPAVLDRLRSDRPDVMMVDHLRVHECGREEVDASSRLLRGTPAWCGWPTDRTCCGCSTPPGTRWYAGSSWPSWACASTPAGTRTSRSATRC
ncbi:hypothetical protein GCM10029963_22290 [Micromonospora andamanensis]